MPRKPRDLSNYCTLEEAACFYEDQAYRLRQFACKKHLVKARVDEWFWCPDWKGQACKEENPKE